MSGSKKTFKDLIKKSSFSQLRSVSRSVSEMKTCLQSGEGADIKLMVGDHTFDAHLDVLASASKWFKRLRDKDLPKGVEGLKMAIATDDADAAKRFLEVVYLPDADDVAEPNGDDINLTRDTKVYMLGDQYDAERVRQAALTAVKIGFAAGFVADDLINACKVLWGTKTPPKADDPMRIILIRGLRKRWVELAEVDGFFEALAPVHDLTMHIQEYASEGHIEAHPDEQEFSCEYCGMDYYWPGDSSTCPGCLHMAALGNSFTPHFRSIMPQ